MNHTLHPGQENSNLAVNQKQLRFDGWSPMSFTGGMHTEDAPHGMGCLFGIQTTPECIFRSSNNTEARISELSTRISELFTRVSELSIRISELTTRIREPTAINRELQLYLTHLAAERGFAPLNHGVPEHTFNQNPSELTSASQGRPT